MGHDLISIIVPIYNSEKYLIKCVNSLRAQTYRNLEIILVNDGSSDNSPKICDQLSIEDNRIKVIHKDNGGVSDARNEGLKFATGNYITFVDSDDYLEETYLEFLYKTLIAKKADLSICGYIHEKEDGSIIRKTEGDSIIINPQEALNLMFSTTEYQGFLWNKLFKKELIGTLQFNEDITICEDLLFVSQYIINCQKITYNPIPQYHYVYHSSSALNSRHLKFNYKNLSELKAYDLILSSLPNSYSDSKKVIKYRKLMSYIGIIYQLYLSKHKDNALMNEIHEYVRKNIFDVLFFNNKIVKMGKYDKFRVLLAAISPSLINHSIKARINMKKVLQRLS